YDDVGNLLTETYIGGPLDGISVTNGYDEFFRRTNLSSLYQLAPLSKVQYSYDAASRLFSVSTDHGAQGVSSATYSYVPNSPLMDHITFANGGVTRLTTAKQYDHINRLTSISSANAQLHSPISYSYCYIQNTPRTRITAP